MGIIPKQYCERFGGHYNTEIKRCVPAGRASQFSKAYILGYVFLIMIAVIALSRIVVIVTGADTPDTTRGGVLFGRFEWHHYYEGIAILIVAAVISLLWERSPDANFILATMYGVSFGLIADELLYIAESTIAGHSDYWSVLYIVLGIIIFAILMLTGKVVSKTPMQMQSDFDG